MFANLYNNQWNTNYPLWIPGSWTASLRVYPVAKGADEEQTVFTPAWEMRQPCVAAFADKEIFSRVEQVERVENLHDLHVLHGQKNNGGEGTPAVQTASVQQQDGRAAAPTASVQQQGAGVALSRMGVRVTAFCPNPDGEGTVLRVWEQAGRGDEITVTLPPVYDGNPDEFAIFEEHRLPMPFVALESVECGDFVALHTLPSPVRGAVHPDQWWSAGVEARKDGADIVLLSGPVGYNRRRSVAKTRPQGWDDWGDAYIALKPGQSIEKTFWIQTGRSTSDAFGFEQAVSASLDLFRPWTLVGRCASMDEILQVKHDYLMTRWIEENGACGFNKWDPGFDGTPGRQVIGLGWTKDTAGPAYALAVLNIRHGDRHMWEDRRVIRDRGNARDFRGGYDPWNPIWLTGFFLATAADFMEMGVDLRLN